MKKILWSLAISAAALTLPLHLQAQEEVRNVDVEYLVIELVDDSQSEYALTDQPIISFKDNNIVIACRNDEISFDMQGVKNYHFKKKSIPLSIKVVPASPDKTAEPSFSFSDATFSGLKPGTRIIVHSLDGKALRTFIAGADGTAKAELSGLPHGIYILRTPVKSFKVVNR